MKKQSSLFISILLIAFSAYGQIPPGYYDAASGLTGAPLKTALFNIIKGHTKKSYNYLWTAFYTTDNKTNDTVWDIYSDIPDSVPPYVYRFGINQCSVPAGHENGCYDREHSFPRSYFGSNESDTIYTDLFHIYPTDSWVNGKRSNYPYAKVGTPVWISDNRSKLGPCITAGYTGTVFEPRDDFKGDLARTYFYIATRYENRIASWETLNPYGNAILNGTSYPCFETWYIDMLLAWNAADTVSQKEIDRNNEIYTTYQHNRNPFIDHPEYAAAIWVLNPGLLPEPTNYPTNFSAHNIQLQWADSIGTVLPDGYLIRMSSVSYNAIQIPVDGIPMANGATDKNVPYGIHQAWFTNLSPNTTFYFKIFAYKGSGAAINYKTDGAIPQLQQSTSP